jgi:hypothetical protein
MHITASLDCSNLCVLTPKPRLLPYLAPFLTWARLIHLSTTITYLTEHLGDCDSEGSHICLCGRPIEKLSHNDGDRFYLAAPARCLTGCGRPVDSVCRVSLGLGSLPCQQTICRRKDQDTLDVVMEDWWAVISTSIWRLVTRQASRRVARAITKAEHRKRFGCSVSTAKRG